MEKIVHSRLSCFLEKQDYFSKFPLEFRENHSTKLAVSYLVSEIANTTENGFITIGIFLDLSEAFDAINHKILITKLYHYGIRGNAHSWFARYLVNRHQYTKCGGAKSNSQIIQHGMPQGSILGPLLFLIFINHFQNCFKNLNLVTYADDTNVFIKEKNKLSIHCMPELKIS